MAGGFGAEALCFDAINVWNDVDPGNLCNRSMEIAVGPIRVPRRVEQNSHPDFVLSSSDNLSELIHARARAGTLWMHRHHQRRTILRELNHRSFRPRVGNETDFSRRRFVI